MKKRSQFEDAPEFDQQYILVVSVNLDLKIEGENLIQSPVPVEEVMSTFEEVLTYGLNGLLSTQQGPMAGFYTMGWLFMDTGTWSEAFNLAIGKILENNWVGFVQKKAAFGEHPAESFWTNDPRMYNQAMSSRNIGLYKSALNLRTEAQGRRKYELVFAVSARWDDEPISDEGPWSANVQLFKYLVHEFGKLNGEFSPGEEGVQIQFDDRDKWIAVSDRVKEVMDELGYKGTVTRYAHGHVKEYYRRITDPDTEDWKSKMPEIDIE